MKNNTTLSIAVVAIIAVSSIWFGILNLRTRNHEEQINHINFRLNNIEELHRAEAEKAASEPICKPTPRPAPTSEF